jgi:hypothetical protein
MRLRPRRRNLVVWSSSAPAGGRDALRFVRPAGSGRIRIGGLLAIIGLLRLAAAVRPRWRPLLAGTVLTVAGVILRRGPGGVVLLPGLLLLMIALLSPGDPQATQTRCELERELAAYSTPAQRRDLEATLDRYPDGDTHELRNILARQAMTEVRN